MIHLDFSQASGHVSDEEIREWRSAFARCGGLHLRGLLSPIVTDFVARRCGPDTFEPRDLGQLGIQIRCADVTAETAVTLALNRSPLLRLLERVTERSPIRSIVGHIARLAPNTDHQLTWHDDQNAPDRLLGLSVHLGRDAYEGGVFQLRTKQDRRLLWEIANTDRGDMIAFTIAPALEHRVTPVTGTVARTVFAGWAMTSPLSPQANVPAEV
jgi:2OG-Fe(II) oxygenase superfamily